MKRIALAILLATTSIAHSAVVSDEEIKTAYIECRTHGVAPGMQSRSNPNYKAGFEGCSEIDKEYNRRDLGNLERQRLIEDQRLKAIKALSDKIKGESK